MPQSETRKLNHRPPLSHRSAVFERPHARTKVRSLEGCRPKPRFHSLQRPERFGFNSNSGRALEITMSLSRGTAMVDHRFAGEELLQKRDRNPRTGCCYYHGWAEALSRFVHLRFSHRWRQPSGQSRELKRSYAIIERQTKWNCDSFTSSTTSRS